MAPTIRTICKIAENRRRLLAASSQDSSPTPFSHPHPRCRARHFPFAQILFRTARFRQGLEGTGAMAPQGSTASKPIWALVFLFPSAARWTAVCHHAPLHLWQCSEQASILTERDGARSPVNSWSEPQMVWGRALQPCSYSFLSQLLNRRAVL